MQIRAARALLDMRQFELSKIADGGISTVKRLELAGEISGPAGANIWREPTEAPGGAFGILAASSASGRAAPAPLSCKPPCLKCIAAAARRT